MWLDRFRFLSGLLGVHGYFFFEGAVDRGSDWQAVCVFLEVGSGHEMVVVRNLRLLLRLNVARFLLFASGFFRESFCLAIFLVEVLHDDFLVIERVLHQEYLVHHLLLSEGDVSEALGLVAAGFHDDVCIHHFSEFAEVGLDALVGCFGVQTSHEHPPVALALDLCLELLLGDHLLYVDGAALEDVLWGCQNVRVGLVGGQLEVAVSLAPSGLLVTSKLQTLDLPKPGKILYQLSGFAPG